MCMYHLPASLDYFLTSSYFLLKCIPLPDRFMSRLLRICLPVRSKPHGCPKSTNTHIDAHLQLTMSTTHCTDIDTYFLSLSQL